MLTAVMVGSVTGTPVARVSFPASNWTTYHANGVESGVAPVTATLTRPTRAWTSPALDGQLYGEPLVLGSQVVVATENDVVYALNATTGAVEWSTTVGSAVPASDLPCGDISPSVGITGTPVIDAGRSEVFVVADELAGAVISHHLVGLGLATGNVLLDQVVDPPGTNTAAQLQRPGLALDEGSVVLAMGGNAGDCSTYHGWVVSVPEGGGTMRTWEVDPSPGNDEGAIWMGGAAPVVDGSGNIWVATGNGSNDTGSPDGSDSVVELSPTLTPVQSFTPSTWAHDNDADYDLGSSPPALMGNGLVFMAGKSHIAYLLKQSRLGGVGGQLAQKASFCTSNVDGGEAFTTTVLYAPCLNGVIAVKVNATRHTMRVLWHTRTGSSGPPIIFANRVWTESHAGVLYGLRKGNGRAAVTLTVGAPANHFPTPSVGAGLLLAPAANRVVAFH
ncbi:MAG TPA: PQQ-binding-like beta-propeller repeat protein [Acidimicrobiales bacterium]|nr:PQQ-binding-like beta-propeller repeat protein [Acidimicrobiales bacterium]